MPPVLSFSSHLQSDLFIIPSYFSPSLPLSLSLQMDVRDTSAGVLHSFELLPQKVEDARRLCREKGYPMLQVWGDGCGFVSEWMRG